MECLSPELSTLQNSVVCRTKILHLDVVAAWSSPCGVAGSKETNPLYLRLHLANKACGPDSEDIGQAEHLSLPVTS